MLPEKLQQKLNQHIKKEDQEKFISNAIEEKLNQHITMNSGETIELYTDGGSRGNPGIAGGGFVAYKNGKRALEGSEFFGEKTNNQSEYLALRMGLREVYAHYPNAKVKCYLDSQLAVEQMCGNYKVKSDKVKPLFEEARRIADQFKSFSIQHIDRSQNAEADRLANEAMDRRN